MAIGSVRRTQLPPEPVYPVSRSTEKLASVAHRKRGQPFSWRWPGYIPALALGVVVIAVWQVISTSGAVASYQLPQPLTVLDAFWRSLRDGVLMGYTITTIEESLAGFLLGTAVALPLAYAIARNRVLARMLEPYIAASQAMPAIALAPLIVVWLGYGLLPVTILCALIVFFPTTVNTVLGLRTLDRDILDAARVGGADRWSLLRYIEIPLAMPSVLAGVRASLTYAITGAVVGEFVLGDQGLGGLMTIARGNFDVPLVFATLLMLGLLASVMYGIGRLAERRLSYLEDE